MNIVLVTSRGYPKGPAGTNRIRSIIENLMRLDNNIYVIVINPTDTPNNIVNKKKDLISGILVEYSSRTVVCSNIKVIRYIDYLIGLVLGIYKILIYHSSQKIDVIIRDDSEFSYVPMLYILTKIIHAKLVVEVTEFPKFMLRTGIRYKIDKFIKTKIIFKCYDGITCITNNLLEFHRRYANQKSKLLHLPMTVDLSRFDNIEVEKEDWITYIGLYSYYKDGIDVLLNSFIAISEKQPNWKLIIIGDTSNDKHIIDTVKNHKLDSKVILMGNIERDSVPELLAKSKILALARPQTIQSEGGFPTKLGEYLATGNLVVITKTGEIENYLKHMESAILANPNDIDDFSHQLNFAIENYDKLDMVRNKGRMIAEEYFCARKNAIKLNIFLKSLMN